MDTAVILFLLAYFFFRRRRDRMRRVRQNRRRMRIAAFIERMRRVRLANNMWLFLARRQLANRAVRRRFWVLPRPQIGWFETMWNDDNQLRYFKQHFRMAKETFMQLVVMAAPEMERMNTPLREAIPVEKRVAIAVWRLAGGASFREVAVQFDVGKSTCVKITKMFCGALNRFSDRFIKFPKTRQETAEAIAAFQDVCSIPQAVGAVDGTHIAIVAPAEEPFDYFDREHRYSVTMQAVVGDNLQFLDTAIGYPGSMHDARILRTTDLYRQAQEAEILGEPLLLLGGTQVRPLLLGDGAYPLLPWLMKPYPNTANLTPVQRRFNVKLSSARSTVERAFGLLKARWRILLKRLDNKFRNVSETMLTCCILHNFCQEVGEEFDDQEIMRRLIALERDYARARPQLNVAQNNCRNAVRIALQNEL